LHEFAVTITAAILVSGVVSVSLTPMLCARFLKPPHETHHGWLYKLTERGFDLTQAAYAFTLRQTLRFHPVAMIISVALLGGTVYLFGKVPTGFIPNEDTGQLMGQTEGLQGVGFDAMTAHQVEAAAIVAADPNVQTLAHM